MCMCGMHVLIFIKKYMNALFLEQEY
uniref:Uncharacterized protein n=1 Tax=Arundo donax TaxID=35708 RepID=A0A0A8ZZ36_ARUDO